MINSYAEVVLNEVLSADPIDSLRSGFHDSLSLPLQTVLLPTKESPKTAFSVFAGEAPWFGLNF